MSRIGIVAVLLAVAAGGAHYWYARELENAVTGGEKQLLLVATRDLNPGEIVKKADLGSRQVPGAFVDERDVLSDRKADIEGTPVQVAVRQGQVLQWTDFEIRSEGENRDLADLVEPGKRAMTIVVNRESSFGGLLRPGHRVDIVGTFAKMDWGSAVSKQRSQVLLQNVAVLATGKQLSSGEVKSGFNTVTLSVTVEQSELLSFAGELGNLSLVLRGYSDLAIIDGIPEKGYGDIFAAPKVDKSKLQSSKNEPIERLMVE